MKTSLFVVEDEARYSGKSVEIECRLLAGNGSLRWIKDMFQGQVAVEKRNVPKRRLNVVGLELQKQCKRRAAQRETRGLEQIELREEVN
jgi:hypothetical protein